MNPPPGISSREGCYNHKHMTLLEILNESAAKTQPCKATPEEQQAAITVLNTFRQLLSLGMRNISSSKTGHELRQFEFLIKEEFKLWNAARDMPPKEFIEKHISTRDCDEEELNTCFEPDFERKSVA